MTISANEILDDHDPESIKNILYWLRQDLDELLNPAPTEIINDFPDGFPPTSINTKTGLKWFVVTDYGAVGDGAADDTIAINNTIAALNDAGRGVLYFPAGSYLVSSSLTTITADGLILGDGTGAFDESSYNSKVVFSSGSATLFTVTALHAKFMHLELYCSASTPSAGSGIKVNGASYLQRVDFTGVRVYGFYIGMDIQVGSNWIMDNCIIQAPVLYGVKIQNTVNTEHGEWLITNSHFYAGLYDSDAAIRIESSGGGKIINSEINMNWGVDTKAFNHGVDISSTVSGFFEISSGLIQNVRGHGIKASGSFDYLTVKGVQFGLSYYVANNTGNCINVNGIDGTIIVGCLFVGGTTPTAVSLTNVAGVRIVGCVNVTFSDLATLSSCTNVVIADPLSTTTPQDVGASGSAGSGITPPKNDHVHKGVHSLAKFGGSALYGDVTISEGANVTITPSGNDLEIASETSGQYRQFTYVVTGGDFDFIIDGDGNPVMALQDLE